ncbi:hypothetical protein DJ71_03750 [Halorubrum sp. E3]|uniref:Uncharacterized protein n=1 Tax=Halorubrum persicum TaxID=1383844 RepID=A0A2G1WFJ7_9EURY|nr:hypothetical protein DJ71_03750 [Halorubrum sp. E3]PHQ37777.1 hypothetical protein DJ69_15230 [Halorubrum persicum]
MSKQPARRDLGDGTVSISQDDEIRLNAAVYQSYFATTEYVRLGTPSADLIAVQPLTDATTPQSAAGTESAYKIDHTGYTGEITCRMFLQRHNYHHTETRSYVAEWWPEKNFLCIDLTDSVVG